MKKIFLLISLFAFAALACNLSVAVSPTSPAPQPTDIVIPNTVIPATAAFTQTPLATAPIPALVSPTAPIPVLPSATASPTALPTDTLVPPTAVPTHIPPSPQPPSSDVQVGVGPLSIVLPRGLASGARGIQFPRAEGQNVAPWDVTPGHTLLRLEGYRLQGKSNQPQIYVYPALDYAVMYPGAFESMHRLNNILADPEAYGSDQFPMVPFFNSKQAFASNAQVISFQNGQGMRFLTEYAQSPLSVNNHDLFYEFQGFSSDGNYYIVAILPISASVLAETSDGGAVLPPGGVPFPDISSPNANLQAYYSAVTDLLNSSSSQAFTPRIYQLDELIQSMRITP